MWLLNYCRAGSKWQIILQCGVLIDGARNDQECNHIDLRYVQSTAARVRDHVAEMAAKRRRRLARVRSLEEFFCTVRSLLASFDRTIFSSPVVCFSLVPRPRPAFRRLQYVVSRSQTLDLAGRRVWSTAHVSTPTPTGVGDKCLCGHSVYIMPL